MTKFVNKPSLLFVDDDPIFADLFIMTFEKEFHIKYAENGEMALKMLELARFDLIISDYEMPGMNGNELMMILSEKYPDIPRVLYTARGDEEVARDAFLKGASDYIIKKDIDNFSRDQFLWIINSLLKNKQLEIQKKQEEEARRKIETTLNRLLSISLLPISFNEQLKLILDEIMSIPDLPVLNRGAIFLASRDPSTLIVEVEKNIDFPDQEYCRELNVGECFCSRAAKTGKIEFISSINKSGKVHKNLPPHSLYCIPIKSGEEMLGTIVLFMKEGTKEDESTRNLFRAIADTLTGLLLNQRLRRRQKLTLEILKKLNSPDEQKDLIRSILISIKEFTKIEAIGIRLRQGDDYPYYRTLGFEPEFIEMENSLCCRYSKKDGTPDDSGDNFLDCMCGNVIRNQVNPALPFYTENGSFWTNSTTDLLNSTSEINIKEYSRKRCNESGYESVALIPLRSGNETLGLLQFNDRKKGCFTGEFINFFEELGESIGVALKQYQNVEALKESEKKHRTLFETLPMGVIYQDRNDEILLANSEAQKILGLPNNKLKGKNSEDSRWQPIDSDGNPIPPNEIPSQISLNTGKSVRNRIMGVYVPEKENYRWLKINSTPLFRGKEKKPSLVYVSFEDITNEKKIEEKLRKSEEHYRLISQSMTDFVYSTKIYRDKKPQTEWITGAFEEISGYTMEEFKKFENSIFSILHPDDKLRIKVNFESLVNGESRLLIYRIITKDGSIKWLKDYFKPIEINPAEGFVRILGGVQDITEQKKAEEELEYSRFMLQLVIDTIPTRLFWKDTESRFLGCNKALVKDAGLNSPKDLIGKTDYDMVWAEQADIYRADDRHVMETKIPKFNIEEPQTRPNGETTWLMTNKSPFYDKDGNVAGTIGCYEDITLRKKMEQELKESEKRFRLAVEQAPFPIMIHADDGEIIMISNSWTELTGYNQEDIPTISEWVVKAYRQKFESVKKVIKDLYNIRGRVNEGEFEVHTKDERKRIWDFSSAPLGKLADGRRAIISIAVDVTRRKKYERELKKYSDTQTVLLREVNHRVKNNLSALISMLHKEEEYAENKGKHEYLPFLKDMIGRIRGLSKVHTLLSATGWNPLEVSLLCEQVINGAVLGISPSKTVKVDVWPSKIKINSNQAHHLTMVLNELATNTVKHGLKNREIIEIDVKIFSKDNKLNIIYRDDGPGYPKEMTEGDYSKTNIGFDLIRGIISHSLDGEVNIRNEEGAVAEIVFENEIDQ